MTAKMIALAAVAALVMACSSTATTPTTPAPTTPAPTTPASTTPAEMLHFDGYDVTREGLTAYLHDSLFAGEDPGQLQIFCNLISQPDFDPRQGDVPVMLWEIEEEEAPGALEKYGVRLVPEQAGDPAYANLPYELTLAECAGFE